ncbi:hypothetical protein [Bartonella grahamii]|uniref:Uncharacterized protein n=2 Tax=Bartonella grahamii TaxID=33045 RepID=A0A336NBH2_BARGR|nr:hypothetical protein [Bartonella grahamii]ACS51858.1 hypothetical protein Bgr_17400 [Bartonella grahamii as4aup]SSZ39420.1 Uncharacterised protein [Bartonella grahamii]
MPSYLKTSYQGVPLYYAGNTRNLIRLEPQKHNAILFISQEVAQFMAKKLEEEYCRHDFSVVQ